MKKNLLLYFPIIMLVGCFNTNNEINSDDTDYMDEPQLMGLQAYTHIKNIVYYDNYYSDFDSLFCNYGIMVIIKDSDWNNKHDHLHVQRLKIDNDTNWWDYASLYGRRRGETEWEEICNKGVFLFPYVLDSSYYRMLYIIDKIGNEIESRQYYFDSEDWASNQEYYESLYKRNHVEFTIRGETGIIIRHK